MTDFELKPEYDVDDFRRIIALLRSPGGCPWDIEQTHGSIRRNMLEEAYEVCEAIDDGNLELLREELGDVLMQVIFHARMEEEKGNFNLDDVADTACKKLIFRHPHVFGDAEVSDSAAVLDRWDELKRKEKSQTTVSKAMEDVAKSLPALWRAEKIQNKAKKVGFDWPDISGAVDKLYEEVGEFESAVQTGNPADIEEELGDVLFSAVNIARFSGVDPELALHKSCEKFIRRFKGLEDKALGQGKKLSDMLLDEMEQLYQITKEEE